MKEEWRESTLGDLCEFRNGLWKGKKPPFVEVGVIRNTNFTKDGQLDDTDIAYLDVEERQFVKRQLQYGDLILEKSGGGPRQPVGRVIPFMKKDGLYSFSNFTSVIRIKDEATLSFRFLHYLLNWYYISGITEGMQRRSTGIRNLNFNAYKELPIPLPPLSEQGRIVAILDEAMAAIDTATHNTQQNLTNATLVAESAFRQIVLEADVSQWRKATVEELALSRKGSIRSGPFGSQLLHGEFVDKGIAVLGIDNAVRNVFRWDKRRFITDEKFEELRRYQAYPDDVIITIMGTCGRCAVVPEGIPPSITSKHLCCISLDKSRCLPRYLHAYFLYDVEAREYLESQAKGSVMDGLNMTIIKALPVRLPPISSQQAILSRMATIETSASKAAHAYARQRDSLFPELRQAILHKAFSGALSADSSLVDRSLSEAGV